MAETTVLNVTLYTRENCGLCAEVKEQLNQLQEQYPHRLAEVDIESDPLLLKTYMEAIPVVEVGPYKLRAPITKQALMMTLGAAQDRRGQLEQSGGSDYQERVRKGQAISRSDHAYFWVSKHYLALLNLVIFLYVGFPFLAPVLMKANLTVPANVLYKIYSPLCHQFGFRSFFLFGEQPYYPLKEAGLTDIKTFDEITGYTDVSNPYSVSRLYARQYVGNPTVGYKVALCERDVAIYLGILIFGVFYAVTGRRLHSMNWMLWILIGLGPIGLDGFSQLFSQFNWPWLSTYLPFRESTPFLRVMTGFLFGFSTAWFAFPNIEESMRETRQFLIKKFAFARAA
jgi:uncharacterized membrane protein